LNKKSILFHKSFPILLVIVFSLIGYSTYFNGCTSSKGTTDTMTPERQKAIEDSILKARKFEIARDWSTGYEYYKNKNYPDAKKYFLRIIKVDPNMRLADEFKYKDIYGRLAQCYIDENQPDSTQWAFLQGVKFNDENAYYHESLGYMFGGKNMFDESIKYYARAIELQPDKAALYKIIGDLYYQTGDVDKAIESYESLTKLTPGDRAAQEKLAAMLRSAGREDEATAQKEKLLADSPNDTNLMSDLGRIYIRNYEYEKALEMFNRVVAIEPENIEAYQYIVAAQMNLENYNGAIETYKKLNTLKPNDVDVMCQLADAYRMNNSFQTARTWARRAINADPNSGLPYITIGDIYSGAAEYCASKKGGSGFDFDDKLVYQIAYNEFQKAKKDPLQIDTATRRMNALQAYLPTAEDKFMHPNQTQAKGDCYKWIY